MSVKALFFDFDGTLADTAPAIVQVMQKTFLHMGLEAPSAESIRLTIGLPLEKCLEVLAGNTGADRAKMAAYYRSIFNDYCKDYTDIFPGVKETLTQLHDNGYRLAICTSRGAPSLDMILRSNGMGDLFENRTTHDDGLEAKPSPHMVLTLLERMKLSADDVIVVGDTTYDILMGNSAGCRTCGVTYGNHDKERLLTAKPTWTIDSFCELLQLV